MHIIKLDKVDSTQKFLKEFIKSNGYEVPICIVTDNQTDGIGSRGNSWNGKKGNLFFSFVLDKNELPNDLQIQSASIYFSFLLKIVLKEFGSNVWLKWPNDFYVNDKKIGGTITTMNQNLIYCGIGLNLLEVSKEYGKLDIDINADLTLKNYFSKIEEKISWKEIFRDFKIEYAFSQNFKTTIENEKISLKNSVLNKDGSIQVNNKKVFSLR
ncbi:biotin--[acetyl-CoA-carboxylase] ligase [Malaciobacter pacificus]|uniref:Biotin-[acetyl-CoA-carboxylase] ligase n=1 Tax=Malaciobacter pacificus TaxID=1080223 RepID=A0A5C2HCW1_9BACT|nr:biotin--[acetyl-CoA-carboxylase] ligase [Malaciobacter pacificus]QEP34966.1 biotin-[acetyl-CoA-carboxylase] ligase [Malaciobacter pacificus]GGD42641.1 biotin--[acetyl-CoA-carboxylase] ligase [Malaciobacter pacificus]